MKTKFTLLVTAALFFTVATQAQGYNDHAYAYNKNSHEVRKDKMDVYRDNARINQDKFAMLHNMDHGNYREAGHDRFEINRDRRERFYDQRELRSNRRDVHFNQRFEKRCY